MRMTFHAHVLSAVLMWFWGVACVLNGHVFYTHDTYDKVQMCASTL